MITKHADLGYTHIDTGESDIENNWTTWTNIKCEEMFWVGSVMPPICKVGRIDVFGQIM